MPPKCTVCTHADRKQIDLLLARDSESLRDIAGQYGLSKTALHRHRTDHLPVKLAQAVEQQEIREGLDVIAQLRAINNATMQVLTDARATGNGDLVLKATDRVLRQLELQAKLLGDLDGGTVVNITVSPQWVELRTVIVQSLTAWPEARQSVAAALLALEAESA